jgi:hypothetical protein
METSRDSSAGVRCSETNDADVGQRSSRYEGHPFRTGWTDEGAASSVLGMEITRLFARGVFSPQSI